MSTLTAEFEFEIGDIVFFKGAEHSDGNRPKLFVIYERIAQECHGGVQSLYRLGGLENFISETLLTRDEPEYRPMSQAWLDELLEIQRAGINAREEVWKEKLNSK